MISPLSAIGGGALGIALGSTALTQGTLDAPVSKVAYLGLGALSAAAGLHVARDFTRLGSAILGMGLGMAFVGVACLFAGDDKGTVMAPGPFPLPGPRAPEIA